MAPVKASDDFTVFISYAHSDNEHSEPSKRWLNRLHEYLQPLVMQNWIRTWSDTEIGIGEQWDKSIETQLLNANAAILLISPAFLNSKYIRNSELPALLMNAMNKGTAVIPIIVRLCPFADTPFKYPDPVHGPNELSLSVFQSANPPDEPLNSLNEHKQDAVFNLVANRIRELARTKATRRSTFSGATVLTVPFTPNRFFTGRAQVFDDLHRELMAGSKAALSGIGGIGKTQTAVEYVRRHGEEYKAVLWVSADSEDSLNTDFGVLAERLHLPVQDDRDGDTAVEAVKRWLEQQSGWLLILDNANDFELVSDFLRRQWPGHILLTTRLRFTGSVGKVELQVMGAEDGALFLLRRAKLIALHDTLETASEDDRQLAAEITKEMGGLPLALDQAGAYIEEMSSSLAEYLKLYRTEGNKLRGKRGRSIADHEPVTITFSLASHNMAEGSAAADMLRICAFLAPDAIPEDIFAGGAKEMGENLAAVAGGGTNLVEVMGEAGRFSLIRRDSKNGKLEIHRVVQKVLRNEMSVEEQRLWAERAVRGLNATFPDADLKSWPLCEKLLPHALEAARLIEKYDLAFVESARLLTQAGDYCFERAQYAAAEHLFKQALAIRERVLGPDHPDVSMSFSNLAALFHHQGRYEEAEPMFKLALAIHDRTPKPDDLNVALILNNLGAFYDSQGRHDEAEPPFKRALDIRERMLGPDHPKVATSLNNLGALYDHMTHYEDAEPLLQRALDIRERKLGPDHPDVAGSLNSLAGVYNRQTRYPESKPLLERSLAIRERALGPDHPDIARNLNNLVDFYNSQGHYDESKPLLERALAICETALGAKHPKVAAIRQQYSELLTKLGQS